jgi:2-iminobutanoate/2-iminopropanoate deaminase
MTNKIHGLGVARQIGTYSDAVEAPANARWLVTAGTPGLGLDGTVPAGIAAQAELAWSHIIAMLERAGMSVHDIVNSTNIWCGPPTSRPMRKCAPAASAAPGRRRCC